MSVSKIRTYDKIIVQSVETINGIAHWKEEYPFQSGNITKLISVAIKGKMKHSADIVLK